MIQSFNFINNVNYNNKLIVITVLFTSMAPQSKTDRSDLSSIACASALCFTSVHMYSKYLNEFSKLNTCKQNMSLFEWKDITSISNAKCLSGHLHKVLPHIKQLSNIIHSLTFVTSTASESQG